jgi:hypothetical protein
MRVNIQYAWSELQRARRASRESSDPTVRAQAFERVAHWTNVLAEIQSGRLAVGSRTPTEAPVWVTLQVMTGGFASGTYVAGGPIRASELALASHYGVAPNRRALNLHFLLSEAADELLATQRYRIAIPEDGALLAVAWLRQRGEIDSAATIVNEIEPWFEELAFYPELAEEPLDAMRASLLVWQPLRARAIALAMELSAPPADWRERVRTLAGALTRAGKPATRRAEDTSRLIELLGRDLTAKERAHVGGEVARYIAKYGAPSTVAHEARIVRDRAAVATPLHSDLRRVLSARLRAVSPAGGVDPEQLLAPIRAEEAREFRVPADAPLPPYFVAKIARSCDASLEELVDRHVITSGEVFARVLPQVTQQVRAATLAPSAALLYGQLYLAFRRRRGLLLLDYQTQVRFAELPWAAALEATRARNSDATSRARKVVTRALASALRAFPQTIIPNKLVTELRSLVDAAELELPFVEELAADIFMGSFTAKFVTAAQRAAEVIKGTLYERYYAIDTAAVAAIVIHAKTSSELAKMCELRAAPLGHGVARNGKILEQAQILTTHNLAVLFDALPIADQLGARLGTLAQACFRWALRRLAMPTHSHHDVLIHLKNAAYAWRQMMFFLSLDGDAAELIRWARTQLARYPVAFRTRFEPAMRGLELAADGVRSDDPAFARDGGRVFTGWSTERHWLAPS